MRARGEPPATRLPKQRRVVLKHLPRHPPRVEEAPPLLLRRPARLPVPPSGFPCRSTPEGARLASPLPEEHRRVLQHPFHWHRPRAMAVGAQLLSRLPPPHSRLCRRSCPMPARKEVGVRPLLRCRKQSPRLRRDDSPCRLRGEEERSGSPIRPTGGFRFLPDCRPRGATAEEARLRDRNPEWNAYRSRYCCSAATEAGARSLARSRAPNRPVGLRRCPIPGPKAEAEQPSTLPRGRICFREARWKPMAGAVRPDSLARSVIGHPLPSSAHLHPGPDQ